MEQVKFNENYMVEIFNDSYGVVGYTTDRTSRDLAKGTKRKISFSELEDVMNTAGGKKLFLLNKLLIKDERVRAYFDLPELGNYNLDREGVQALLRETDLSKLEEVLMYCPQAVLDKIVQEAIEIGIDSLPQASLIRGYSGVDVAAVIEEKKEATSTQNKPVRQPLSSVGSSQATGQVREFARPKSN